MEQTKNVKVHYFDAYGRGEIIRFILSYNNIKFEDIRYDWPTWAEQKKTGKFPFGQLPALEVDGKIYAQSMSIARYLTQKFGQYPHDSYESYLVEQTRDHLEDITRMFTAWYYEKDQEKKNAIHLTFLKESIPPMLPGLTRILKENKSGSGYFVGDKLTFADFLVAEFGHRYLFHKDRIAHTQETLAANPELHTYLKNITEKHFKTYFENRKYSFN